MTDFSNLTTAQSLIWTGQALHPDVPLYNMVLSFRIAGPVDPEVFQTAFDALVAATDSLRTTFKVVAGSPTRTVKDHDDSALEIVDLSSIDDAESESRSLIETAARESFDLEHRMYRSGLIKLGDNDFIWWLSQHHLITDGWSSAVVFGRMEELYQAVAADDHRNGLEFDYPQFEFYADFERRFRGTKSHVEEVAYWNQKQLGEPAPLSFYGIAPSPGGNTRTDRVTTNLGEARAARLADFITEGDDGASLMSGVSEFSVFASVLAALLSRISERQEFAILAPAHNRPSPRFKATAGLFIEVLPLQIAVDEHDSFRSLMAKASSEAHELLLHGRPATSSAASNRASSVLLNFINAGLGKFNGWPVRTDWVHPGHGDADHALRLQVHDFDQTGDRTLHFDVSTQVFDVEARERLIRHFLLIFDALLESPDQEIRSLDLLSESEKSEFRLFNETTVTVAWSSVVEAFRLQTRSNPDAVAVRDGDRMLSYGDLDARSENLAHQLRTATGPTSPVAVYLPRSLELVVAIWGALKSGRAYVPIDRHYPAERIGFILDDSSAGTILTDAEGQASIADSGSKVEILGVGLDAGSKALPRLDSVDPSGLAYIMYTSGSTGEPKGVRVTHAGLVNYVSWSWGVYSGGGPVSFPFYSSFGFDLTVTSLFLPLVSGGEVVVYREPDGNDLTIRDVFDDDRVDVVKLTPSHLALLDPGLLATRRIKTLVIGGEDLKTSVALAAHEASGNAAMRIFNEYGPTEATVACMTHLYDPAEDRGPSVPLGRPAANTRIQILDSDLRQVPIGVVGEICVSGVGVALGYLNRPDLTEQSFVVDPTDESKRLYRTGDLARWRRAGEIEFLGRSDDQVKVKGFRVELGEIENGLNGHPKVIKSHVGVVESETNRMMSTESIVNCVRCGLASNHPDSHIDSNGVCRPCHFYDSHKAEAEAYWGTTEQLQALLDEAQPNGEGQDCIMLLSGGKDSTYALYQLVQMGRRPLVFTLDNGFISEGAKSNIRRAVDDLGLELVMGETKAMNDIFAESLAQFSNVCQGCFKTVYTMAISLARRRGLRHVVTGLSRGQIFETRLADLFRVGIVDPGQIDSAIVEARRAYHRKNDVVRRSLDTTVFDDDSVFTDIQIVDFYRYLDVGLSDLLGFLNDRAPWVRPADTGRSTNCLINNTGIFVHKAERGYHNYSLPYSWDVRLGHKTRDAALAELDDDIDVTQVRGILEEVGYELETKVEEEVGLRGFEKRLVGYYVGQEEVSASEVRKHLLARLPDYMVPTYLVALDEMPLTINGKVDSAALPDPRVRRRSADGDYVAPRGELEKAIAEVWQEVLGIDVIGVEDAFTELGGDSILNIQIISSARTKGIEFTPQQLFESGTISALAKVAVESTATPVKIGSPRQPDAEEPVLIKANLEDSEVAELLAEYGEGGS